VPNAFFVLDDGHFVPTELTRGPWDPDHQHAGPAAALIGRALEQFFQSDHAGHIGRVTFDILRPIPMTELALDCRLVRGGRSVQLAKASLSDADGEVLTAHAWRIRTAPLGITDGIAQTQPPPPPSEGTAKEFFPTGSAVGYHTAMESLFVRGSYRDRGPASVWFRMRYPLILGEEPSPLTRILVAADSTNGVSAAIDYKRYFFINTELTVHLHKLPEGEWVCLDAMSFYEADGVGCSEATLYDQRGRLGRCAQSLMLAERH
jgi:hypothetical protein